MTNREITKLLRKISVVYELTKEIRFKIIAYEKAAEAVENSTIEIKDLWKDGKLESLEGVGKTIASHLDELFRTGKVRHFESVLRSVPSSIFPLLEVFGIGPKKAYKLVTILKLSNPETVLDDLRLAASQNRIAPIEHFGDKSQEDILAALESHRKGRGKEDRMQYPFARQIADRMVEYLKKCPYAREVTLLGSLRRGVETIGDIDIAVATEKGEEVINHFINYPDKIKVIEKGPAGATLLISGQKKIDLRVQAPHIFGSMLQYFTGSKNHNIRLREFALKKGLSLSEYGIKKLSNTQYPILNTQNYNSKLKIYEYGKEEDFYNALDLPWIPPELREDRGEIEEAQNNRLPYLIDLKDIKGEFHIHSNYDLSTSHDLGSSSLETIIRKAEEKNYEYIGISDHNPGYTNNSPEHIESILKKRKANFEQIISSTKSTRVHLFFMLETDILPDGKLPLSEQAFKYLDAIIVSVHSSFKLNKTEMTNRVLMGLSHPKAKILAHPTGRLIGKRDPYELDWTRIFKFCKEFGKALEINSNPQRLDINDIIVKEAIHNGVKLVIDTDSHDASQMDLIQYGITVARRGWAAVDDILNTKSYNSVKAWFQS